MIKYLFGLIFVQGWIINYLDSCTCSELTLSSVCTQSGYQCSWNSATQTCVQFDCSVYTTQQTCSKQINCYYNVNTDACVSFTSCNDVPFNTSQECSAIGCKYYSGNYCSKKQCSQYNTTNCPSGCYNNGIQCAFYTECSQYTQAKCPNNEACQWNTTQLACVQATCSYFSGSSCMLIQQLGSELYSPCIYQSGQCVDATDPAFFPSAGMCYTNTNGRYYWNGTSNNVGSCVPCQPGSLVSNTSTIVNQTNSTTITSGITISKVITNSTTSNTTIPDPTPTNSTTDANSTTNSNTTISDTNTTSNTTNEDPTTINQTDPTESSVQAGGIHLTILMLIIELIIS